MCYTLSPPIPFGRYLLVEKLAVGGMAEIYRAKSVGAHGFEKTFVIKRILPQMAKDDEFIKMFIQEAKLMVQLSHPKVVQVLDFGEVDGCYFIVMEYVKGIDTLALLRRCAHLRARPTTGIAVHIIAEVLDALDYAHNLTDEQEQSLGIVHRDVSPSNIFISEQGEIKLGDFGIAMTLGQKGSGGVRALKGKYGYMAPEVVSKGEMDYRADIFSAGAVLAELLILRRLFYAKNELEILLQVRDANLHRLERYGKHLQPDMRHILESALARDPDNRYQDSATFREALHRYLFDHRLMVRNLDVRRFLNLLDKKTGTGPGVDEEKEPHTLDAFGKPPVPQVLPTADRPTINTRVGKDYGPSIAVQGPKPPATPQVEVRATVNDEQHPGELPVDIFPEVELQVSIHAHPVGPGIQPSSDVSAAGNQRRPVEAWAAGQAEIEPSSTTKTPVGNIALAGRSLTRSRLKTPVAGLIPPEDRAIIDFVADDEVASQTKTPTFIGRKRRISLGPPPKPEPVPSIMPETGESPRIDTAMALDAVPEVEGSSSELSRDFLTNDSYEIPLQDVYQFRLSESKAGDNLPQMPLPSAGIGKLPASSFSGDLAQQSLIKTLFRLALAEGTGLLLLQAGEAVKEIYMVNGDPQYVASNLPQELFGQYLVQRHAITEGELSMALAMLPHYDGKLGNTLVALRLLRPVEVLRHLTHQVRQKLVDAFSWGNGSFTYYQDFALEHAAAPLGLDAFEMIGEGVNALHETLLNQRLEPLLKVRLQSVSPPPVPPEVFRMGSHVRSVYDKLDGRMALGEMLQRYDALEQRRLFAQTVYLLVETGLARAL